MRLVIMDHDPSGYEVECTANELASDDRHVLRGLAEALIAELSALDYLEATDDDPDACTSETGHEFVRTGTAYGGDDERWGGEGRSLCVHCGADGDA